MADLNNITPMKGLPPFLQYFRTIGIIPASYKVTMTYEEQVLELMRFIKDEIIPKINENVLATTELQEKFKQLVTYVDEYFENLDIQKEVNVKLDEMAESGVLAEIINENIFNDLNNKVNLIKNFSNVKNIMQVNIIEDLEDFGNNIEWYFPQGACSHNGIVYQYMQYQENGQKSEYGEIRVYNPKTFTKINTLSGIKGYHGNDMCYLNNKLYIASCNVGSELKNVLVVYDLTNNTTSEINLGVSENSLYGVTRYSDNELIIALNNNSQDINAQYYYIYNVDTGALTPLTVNTNNYKVNYWGYLQNIEYYNNCLYLLTSNCNSIIECVLENNIIKIVNIITLPIYDCRNIKIGECESLFTFEDEFGLNTFGLACGSQRNQILDNAVYQLYLINFKNGISETPVDYIWDTIQGMYNKLYLNNLSNSLLELGTSRYPFKDLARAIQSANKSNTTIEIVGGNTYKGCSVHGKEALNILLGSGFENDVTIKHLRFANCRCQIANDSSHELIIKNSNDLYNSALFINDKTYMFLSNVSIDANNEGRAIWNDYAILHFKNCVVKNSTDKAIENTNGTLLSTPTFNNCTGYYIYNSTGIVKINNSTNVPQNKIFTSPSATTIYNGTIIENIPIEHISKITNLISSLNVHNQSTIKQTGKQIVFNMLILPNTEVNFDNNTTIFELPQNLRPANNQVLTLSYNKTLGFAFVRASDGNVRIQTTGNIPANTEIFISGSYFVN